MAAAMKAMKTKQDKLVTNAKKRIKAKARKELGDGKIKVKAMKAMKAMKSIDPRKEARKKEWKERAEHEAFDRLCDAVLAYQRTRRSWRD
jgi:hypothetical protein